MNIDNCKIINKLDYEFLEKKYNDKINTNMNYDTGIDDLKDLDKAGMLLKKHILAGNKIGVVTDYDSDGINSAVTLTKGLCICLGVPVENVITIVNRRKHGNGFNDLLVNEVIESYKVNKFTLMITADHGSNDNKAYTKIKEETGLDIIVTDHHTITNYPYIVDVFINPMREDSIHHKSISGCTVAFMLIIKTFNLIFNTRNYSKCNVILPNVAVSVITDCMELSLPYNRFIVKMGLRVMNSGKYQVWNIIKQKLGVVFASEFDLGFKIGPVINCGNSLNQEPLIYKMLMCEDFDNTVTLVEEALHYNKLRKVLTDKYSQGVVASHNKNDSVVCDVITVSEDAILNGKVASSAGGVFSKPTIIFSGDANKTAFHGSGRSMGRSINMLGLMHKIAEESPDMFIKYGGHYGALGCTIKYDKYDEFKKLFNKYTMLEYKELDSSDTIKIDAFVPSSFINMELYEKQQQYSPFGIAYEEPIYLSRLRLDRYFPISTIAKLSFSSLTTNETLDGIYFFNDTYVTKDNIRDYVGKNLYVAYKLKMNSFKGSFSLSLNIIRMEEIK